MNFVGIDLHKKTISLGVVNQEREVLDRKRLYCSDKPSRAGRRRKPAGTFCWFPRLDSRVQAV